MKNRAVLLVALFAQCAAWGCSGGGSSSGGRSHQPDAVWPDGEGGATSKVPAVVKTGRVVFESEKGESCCLELDPGTIWGGGDVAGQPLNVVGEERGSLGF